MSLGLCLLPFRLRLRLKVRLFRRPRLQALRLLTRLRRGRRPARLARRLRTRARVQRRLHHQRRFRFHHPHAMAGPEAGYLLGGPERPPGGGLDGSEEG